MLLGRTDAFRAHLGTCAPSPWTSTILWKSEAFPLRGLDPPRMELFWGVSSVVRSAPGELFFAPICFRFGETRVCMTRMSLNRVKKDCFQVLWGKNCIERASSRIIHYLVYNNFSLLFSRAYYVAVTHVRGHIAGSCSPSPLPAMVGGIPPSRYIYIFLQWKILKFYIAGEHERDPSAASTQQQMEVLI